LEYSFAWHRPLERQQRCVFAVRGISPVIATVIILAVTVAIAVAVIGWITGLFGAATGGTEQLQIMPDSYINSSNVLHLHIVNKGSDVSLYKVEIAGLYTASKGDTNSYYYLSTSGDVKDKTFSSSKQQWNNFITIKAGEDAWLIINKTDAQQKAVPGTSYTVKVYTKNGNVFTATVVAESKKA